MKSPRLCRRVPRVGWEAVTLNRRAFLSGAISAALAIPLTADAQQAVGVIWSSVRTATVNEADAFERGLQAHGYVGGKNIVVEHRWAEGRADLVSGLARELVDRRVAVVVTDGTSAVQAVRAVAGPTPIVMAGAGDPIGTGLVASLARPGGNITGISLVGGEILKKGLEIFKEGVPGARRIAVLMNAANPANSFLFRHMEEGARILGAELQRVDVRDASDIQATIAGLQADAAFVLADPLFISNLKTLTDSAMSGRLPMAGAHSLYARQGALMAYTFDFEAIFYRAAEYVVRILKGTNPGDLPVEQPTKFQLVINLKTAKRLGLTIPRSLLARADQVIE